MAKKHRNEGHPRNQIRVFRGKLRRHEIALLAEMYASGMSAKAIAARFA
jgi:hypothetical protein